MIVYQMDKTWVLWLIVIIFVACCISVLGWSISQWSPKHKAEAARIEEQTRLNTIEQEEWIQNELPEVHATWGKVLQGLLVVTGIVLVALGLCWMVVWVINVRARHKAYKRLPAWQSLPQNRAVLLPSGMVYHTGHGATDTWWELGEADTGRLLAAGEADAMRARAILEALRRVAVPNRPQKQALEWAECKLLEGESEYEK